ncbi:hypothetical protein BC332_25616 [Capsicum chinense]|nr:hypothetical protein BC332_25616 [Capsicum chinense]
MYLNPKLGGGGGGLGQGKLGNLQRSEEVKRVMEIMLRRKKRNQVLVGEGELESVVNDLLSKIEKGELGVLKDIQIVQMAQEFSHDKNEIVNKIKELGGVIESKLSNCGGVIVHLDLKWLVEQQQQPPMIFEIGKSSVIEMGNCKIKNLKSTKGGAITKKMRIGWTSKAKDKILTTDVDDLENNENSVQSPIDNNKINDDNVNMVIDIDRRIGNVNVNSSRKRGTRVSEDGGKTDPEAQDLNVSSERNGVKLDREGKCIAQFRISIKVSHEEYDLSTKNMQNHVYLSMFISQFNISIFISQFKSYRVKLVKRIGYWFGTQVVEVYLVSGERRILETFFLTWRVVSLKRRKEQGLLVALGSDNENVLAVDISTGFVRRRKDGALPSGAGSLFFVGKGRRIHVVAVNGLYAAQCIWISNDAQFVVTVGFGEKQLQVWKLDFGERAADYGNLVSMKHPPVMVECRNNCKGEDGRVVLAISKKGVCYVWNFESVTSEVAKPIKI